MQLFDHFNTILTYPLKKLKPSHFFANLFGELKNFYYIKAYSMREHNTLLTF